MKLQGYILLLFFCTSAIAINLNNAQGILENESGICVVGADACSAGVNVSAKNGSKPTDSFAKCICLTFFYSPTCEHCHRMDAFLSRMEEKYPQLNVRRFNVLDKENAKLKESYDLGYNVPEDRRGLVPAIYIGDRYFIGESSEAKEGIEAQIRRYAESGIPCSCTPIGVNEAEKSIIERFLSFSFLAVMLAAAVDSINPCAMAGIVFFISYLALIGKRGRSIILVGITYSLGVFLAYLLMGLGILGFLSHMQETVIISKIIYPITALVALGFAVYSFLDYRKAKEGKLGDMTLQLPRFAKVIVRKFVRKMMSFRYIVIAAFITGFVISLFEFLCTGQVYLPTIVYIMGVSSLRAQAMLYLLFYNLVFVAPIVVIFLAAYFGTTSKEIGGFVERHVALVKLLTALFFLLLASYLILMSLQIYGL